MSKKTKKAKLPKRIAGVKVPKALRRQGGPLLALLDTPQAKAVVASGLAAAAATLTGTRTGAAGDGKMTAKKARRRVTFAAEEGLERAGEIAETVGAAVTAAMEKWFGGSFHREKATGAPVAKPAARTAKAPPKRNPEDGPIIAH